MVENVDLLQDNLHSLQRKQKNNDEKQLISFNIMAPNSNGIM